MVQLSSEYVQVHLSGQGGLPQGNSDNSRYGNVTTAPTHSCPVIVQLSSEYVQVHISGQGSLPHCKTNSGASGNS